ncbi:carboxylesterase family protein [Sphingobacterium rhinopitheci]|uniref:carboxylesterase family protein n=1 Tax=Sphingobacterium rhinopitheci TaxID=2781960 RepID=UPI001F517929|nr:prolyl oligopeptidase family serine peptidase [Sphingobacterium rhinopitheci]MCI0921950.1 prolyl oligopeptidase family serine peptidase [Sphingobacterium rhinopitheci]
MNRIYLLTFCFVITFLPVFGELIPVMNKTKYNFLVKLPSDYSESGDKQPIVIFLHGKSLSGKNLERVKRYGVLYAAKRGKEIPGIVVAPQTNNGWNPDNVMEVLDYVLQEYNGDPSRVYICGMSMGAYGTMDVAGKYPERISAAVAICGGGSLSYACNLTKVPLWIQHGNMDRAVPASESKKIYNAIKSCNPDADATLTIIPGGTHGSVERLFHQDEIYEWMFSHKRL